MAAILNLPNAAPPVETLETLTAHWIEAKRLEDEAKAERVRIESAILDLHPAREEGSETIKLESGFKLTLTGKLTYKVADVAQLATLAEQLPASLRPIKTVVEPDEAGIKWLRQNEPELYRVIAPAVEVKPAKTAIRVGV